MFSLLLILLGMRIRVEVRTNRGRVDAVVETKTMVYVFEFKLNGTAAEALKRIDCNDCARRFKGTGKRVYCVGASFDTASRNIGAYLTINSE